MKKARPDVKNKARSVRGRVSAEEWRLRCELAAAHRLIAHFVFVDMTYNHISVRLPESPNHFLVKPDNQFMENHGALVCGTTLPEAYIYHHFFELACRAQVGAAASGAELVMPAPETCAERVKKFGRIGVYDSKSRDWVASMALVEKLFPDYKR